MGDSHAFFVQAAGNNESSQIKMYQLGQLFTAVDPSTSSNYVVKDLHDAFKKTKNVKTLTLQNRSEFQILDNTFFKNKYNKKKICAALKYPLEWILKADRKDVKDAWKTNSNGIQPLRDRIDMKFFENTYQVDGVDNKDRCQTNSLFKHQKFIEYALRPYSPIQSLIVNSRTGSGKTRMMQVVLDNFARFPNKKIILFPNEVLREAFYNKTVKEYSKIYSINKKGGIKRRVETIRGRKVEMFDDFNTRYSKDPEKNCSVNGRFDHPLFEEYFKMYTQQQSPLGSTIILTFAQFHNILLHGNREKKEERPYGWDMVFKNGAIDLGGAMVLVDEAHLLLDDESVQGKKIRIALEYQSEKLHTIGLFTATPFEKLDDITKFGKLLNISPSTQTNAKYIARNHMMYYNNKAAEHMFNAEDVTYITVPKSDIISNRAKLYGMVGEFANPRLDTHCWFTHFDFMNYPDWDTLIEKHHPGDYRNGGIKEQYRRLMSPSADTNAYIADMKKYYPKMAFALENVLDQYNHRDKNIKFWTKCLELDKKSDYQSMYTYAEELSMVEELGNSHYPYDAEIKDAENRGDKDPHAHWIENVNESLKTAYEDRIVIMTDLEHGIIEFSTILEKFKITHVILQIEKRTAAYTGSQKQVYGYAGDLDTKDQTIIGTLKDNKLVQFVNDNPQNIPVVLFNSFVPEGISLFDTRNLHILTMDTTYTNITQMIGRINRLCHMTKENKRIFMYCYKESGEEARYRTEIKNREGWPCLNM